MGVILAVVVAIVVSLATLAVVPLPRYGSFDYGGGTSGTGPVGFQDTTTQEMCPAGASATVSYSSSGLALNFTLTAPNGTVIWSQTTPNGTTSFLLPACGFYLIDVAGSGSGEYSVEGSWSYRAPLL